MKHLLLFALLFCSSLVFGQCASTSYGNGTTCVQFGHDSHVGNTDTVTVALNPTAGNQLVVFAYWCESSDCLTTPTHTVTIGSNTSTACFSASPNSPLYLNETGAQKVANYMTACNSVPAGTVTTTLTCSVSGACWYLTIVASEWTGLATSQPMFDVDGGCGSTAAGTSGSCSTSSPSTYIKDLVLGYWTTISDYVVTFTAPSGVLNISSTWNTGGTLSGITVADAGTQTLTGHWCTNGFPSPCSDNSDSWTVPMAAIKSAASVLAATPSFPAPVVWVATPNTANTALRCGLVSAGGAPSGVNCKTSPGNVYGYRVVNTTATTYYLRMYNASSAPTCSSSTGFVEAIPIPGSTSGAGVINIKPGGEAYSAGIGFCFTGGSGSTDTTNAAVGVFGAVLYK